MIDFECPNCGGSVSVGNKHAGKRRQCPSCKKQVSVPKGVSKATGASAPAQDGNRGTQGDAAAELTMLKAELDKERQARTELETRLRETEERVDAPAQAAPETAPTEEVLEADAAPMLPAGEELPFERMQRETAELRQTARTRPAFSSIDAQARIDRLRQETGEDVARFLTEATLLADAHAAAAPPGKAPKPKTKTAADKARTAELEGARRATQAAQAEVQEARLAAKAAEERARTSEGLVEEIRHELEALRAEKEGLTTRINALESAQPAAGAAQLAEAAEPTPGIEADPEAQGTSELEDTITVAPTEGQAQKPAPEDIEELPEEGGLAEALVAWGNTDETSPEKDAAEEVVQSADERLEAAAALETKEAEDLAAALQAWGRGGEEKASEAPERPSPKIEEDTGQAEAEVEEGEAKPVGEEEKHSGLGGALRAMREKGADRAEQGAEPDPQETKRGKAAMVDALQRFMHKK